VEKNQAYLLAYLLILVVNRYCWRVPFTGAYESRDVDQVYRDERYIFASHQGNGRPQSEMYVAFFYFDFM